MKNPGFMLFGFLAVIALQQPVLALDVDQANTISISCKLPQERSLTFLFASSGDSAYWGPDLLPGGTRLASGATLVWEVYYPDQSARFDLLAVDDAGGVYKIQDVELKDGSAARIVFDNSTRAGRQDADFGLVEVRLENLTGSLLEYVFLAPEDSKAWGIDLLDQNASLDNGKSLVVYIPKTDQAFWMEACLVAADGREYQKKLEIRPDDESTVLQIEKNDLQQ